MPTVKFILDSHVLEEEYAPDGFWDILVLSVATQFNSSSSEKRSYTTIKKEKYLPQWALHLDWFLKYLKPYKSYLIKSVLTRYLKGYLMFCRHYKSQLIWVCKIIKFDLHPRSNFRTSKRLLPLKNVLLRQNFPKWNIWTIRIFTKVK